MEPGDVLIGYTDGTSEAMNPEDVAFSISMGLHVVDPSGHCATAGLSEGRHSANKIELFLFKPVEIIFGQATVTKQAGENEWKSGVPVVVPSVDLPPTLGQPVFQIPQIRRFLDPCDSAFKLPG
jgi:hypothetical protein